MRASRFLSALLVLAGTMLLVAGCGGSMKGSHIQAAPPDSPPASSYAGGQLVRPDGSPASEQDFLRLAGQAEYILLGERHDNPLDHQVQARLLASLAESGKKPVLGLEMLPRRRYDRQLAAFSKGRISLESLPEKLDWPRTWGFDFALYKPLFAVVEQYSLPAYGLNIPNEVRLGVSRRGLAGLTPSEKKELPAVITPPLPEQRQKLADFFRQHGAMMVRSRKAADTPPGSRAGSTADSSRLAANRAAGMQGRPSIVSGQQNDPLERFLLIQSLWDSTMAEQAVRLHRQYTKSGNASPVVIVAGGGHVEYEYGIAHRLRTMQPGARILSVMPFSDRKPEAEAASLFYFSSASSPMGGRPRIGLTLARENDKLRVTAVADGSRAEKAGFQVGDILERAGSLRVQSAEDLHTAAQDARKRGFPLTIAVQRQGKFTAMLLPEK